MIDRAVDPRTEDTIVYELLCGPINGTPSVIGRATFQGGRSRVDAPDAVSVAVSELLAQTFVDRVAADERPRGYRRTGRGQVDMLVPGMPEHFVARLRGLWLPYPDGTVVTARPAGSAALAPPPPATELDESGAPVTDAAVRRSTLASSGDALRLRPLVAANDPLSGLRPAGDVVAARTDCGWIT